MAADEISRRELLEPMQTLEVCYWKTGCCIVSHNGNNLYIIRSTDGCSSTASTAGLARLSWKRHITPETQKGLGAWIAFTSLFSCSVLVCAFDMHPSSCGIQTRQWESLTCRTPHRVTMLALLRQEPKQTEHHSLVHLEDNARTSSATQIEAKASATRLRHFSCCRWDRWLLKQWDMWLWLLLFPVLLSVPVKFFIISRLFVSLAHPLKPGISLFCRLLSLIRWSRASLSSALTLPRSSPSSQSTLPQAIFYSHTILPDTSSTEVKFICSFRSNRNKLTIRNDVRIIIIIIYYNNNKTRFSISSSVWGSLRFAPMSLSLLSFFNFSFLTVCDSLTAGWSNGGLPTVSWRYFRGTVS